MPNAENAVIPRHIFGLSRQGQVMRERQGSLDAQNARIHGENTTRIMAINSLPHTIIVRVKPTKNHTRIVGFYDDILIVEIKSPPIKGKANKELLGILKKEHNKDYTLVSGHNKRTKKLSSLH